MAHKITIKYTAPVAPNVAAVSPICRCFYPAACAADHPCMEGTYYDTNVEGWGEATKLEQFMAQQVAHPGLVAATKQAIAKGEYTIEEADEAVTLYIHEVAPALKDQGFTFVVDGVTLGEEESDSESEENEGTEGNQ
ncbi:MAG: hypothetical protein J6I97_08340 [Agathobacter sp.]|nr:hypothetical protein [Agathobacter sp.]